jgi:hypothetical protein
MYCRLSKSGRPIGTVFARVVAASSGNFPHLEGPCMGERDGFRWGEGQPVIAMVCEEQVEGMIKGKWKSCAWCW